MDRATVTVGIGNMGDAGDKGGKPPLLNDLAGCEGKGSHGSTMKGSQKGDDS